MNPDEIDALIASKHAGNAADPSAAAPGMADAAPVVATPGAPTLVDFEKTMLSGTEVPIGMLLDLSLPVSIELGRTNMTVQELLRLGRGSVIQLDRLAGEPIDIFVGDRRFAEGEVVVLGEHFGVRITRIVSTNPAASGQVS